MPKTSLFNRRQFLGHSSKGLITAGLLALPVAVEYRGGPSANPAWEPETPARTDPRKYWISVAERLGRPVLENLAGGTLKKNMVVEGPNARNRQSFAYLEAFGRLIAGIAPWLELDRPEPWTSLAHQALDQATRPDSSDCMEFTRPYQPLVDAAYLALALLRAPKALWEPLDAQVRQNVLKALKSTRGIKPWWENNWLLFPAIIETALHVLGGEPMILEPVETAFKKLMEWYKGDGLYGDGSDFHLDYYNSYAIHPMLLDLVTYLGPNPLWSGLEKTLWQRAQRFAALQERMISPEGAFPILGRSMTYRFGAFHALSHTALAQQLPNGLKPAQVRCALTSVIRRIIEAPGNFDSGGWLRVGFCGHQPGLAEGYITTGSQYMCALALLPLGLPASAPFWRDADEPWTSVKAWSGQNLLADRAL